MRAINIIDTDRSDIWSHENLRVSDDKAVYGHADTVEFNSNKRVDIQICHAGNPEEETISYVPWIVVKEEDGTMVYDFMVDEDEDPEIAVEAAKDAAEYVFNNQSEHPLN